MSDEVKERIGEFARSLGVEDFGVAAASEYKSPRSLELSSIFPEVKSLVVLAFRELSSCDSENMQIATNGRLDLMEFSRSCNYKLASFLEREFEARAMTVPVSYPLLMARETLGSVADVSTRHAAVAAGLGNFGRHNMVIHPDMGTRVIFTVVMTDLELPSDPPITERLCTDCGDCVESCPGGALDEEGKTDVLNCLRHSQPYGIGANIRFWSKFAEGTVTEQQDMLADEFYWKLYQAGFIGFQYFCFNCLKVCPIGQD
jgi:epoxyqueuosine reductase QueG